MMSYNMISFTIISFYFYHTLTKWIFRLFCYNSRPQLDVTMGPRPLIWVTAILTSTHPAALVSWIIWLAFFSSWHSISHSLSSLHWFVCCIVVFMIGLVCEGHPPMCQLPTSSTSSTGTTTVSICIYSYQMKFHTMRNNHVILNVVSPSLDTNRALPPALKQHPLQPQQKQRPLLQAQQT